MRKESSQCRRYDETVSLQKPERTGATEIGSVKGQRTDEVEVLMPEVSAAQSQDLSETRPGVRIPLETISTNYFSQCCHFFQELLETIPGHFNSLRAILLESLESIRDYFCPIQFPILTGHQSGVKGLNTQDGKDHPNSLLSKTNEEGRIKTSAGCDVEDVKAVNSSRWEKRKWKKTTEDGISQESNYLFPPPWHIPKEMLANLLGKFMIIVNFCVGTKDIFQQLSCLLSFALRSIHKNVHMSPKCRWMVTIFFIAYVVTTTNAQCLELVYVVFGKEGVLPCTYENYSVVGWADEPDVPLLIYRENGTQKGPKYEAGEFGIQENGSLIIKNVEMKHTGNYTSLYVPQQSGEHNKCEVEVRVLPVAPCPVIDGCHSKLGDCMLTVPRYGILNCSIQVFPGITGPDLNLTMESETALLHLVDGPTTTEWNGKTFLKSSFSYEIEKSAGPFEIICRVEGLPPIDPRTKATVNVEGLPVAPYPVIDGCHSKLGDCMLTVPRDGILTCSVQVFPGITGPDLNLTMKSETAVLHLVDGPTITHWNGNTFLKSSSSYDVEKSAGTFEIECLVGGLSSKNPRTKATVNVKDEVQLKVLTGVCILMVIVIILLLGLVFFLAKRKELCKSTRNKTPAATDSNSVAYHGNHTRITLQNDVNETDV